MALTDESGSFGTTMLVQPSSMGGNGNIGNWGGSDFWILLLFILLGGNGWGNGFGGFGGGNAMADMYPWMNQSNQINGGFRDQMLNDSISGIRDGVQGLSTQLCNGFSQAEISANARQMADMNQTFGLQTAMMQGFNGVQSQFADCLKKIIKKAKDSLVFTKYTVGSCVA